MIRTAGLALHDAEYLELAKGRVEFVGRELRLSKELVECEVLRGKGEQDGRTLGGLRRMGGIGKGTGSAKLVVEAEQIEDVGWIFDQGRAVAQHAVRPRGVCGAREPRNGSEFTPQLEAPTRGIHASRTSAGFDHDDDLAEGRQKSIAFRELMPQWRHRCGELAAHSTLLGCDLFEHATGIGWIGASQPTAQHRDDTAARIERPLHGGLIDAAGCAGDHRDARCGKASAQSCGHLSPVLRTGARADNRDARCPRGEFGQGADELQFRWCCKTRDVGSDTKQFLGVLRAGLREPFNRPTSECCAGVHTQADANARSR